METYYARSCNDKGEKETVEHHLTRAGELCEEFLEPIGYGDWGKMLGETHDFGKYSRIFAEVLDHKRIHVNHAMPGAALLYMFYSKKSRTRSMITSVVGSHHGKLRLLSEQTLRQLWEGKGHEELDEAGYTYSLYGQEEMKHAYDIWSESFSRMPLKSAPDFRSTEDPSLSKMLFMRFLFSALVDADYSSSAEHFQPDYLMTNTGRRFDPEESIERLQSLLQEKRQNSSAASSLNELRNELFEECYKAAERKPGLYNLTAPTGLGKTLSLFAFAARHCQVHGKRRVILVLPYLSILEQNVQDYRRMVPDLLEIHSNASLDERARLLSERWSAPCIVTTNVGLMEPLFSSEPTRCRHLHQLSDSVIVLDEAQSLPVHLLRATLRTLKLLCDYYGCTVVLSTATQPSYEYLSELSWEPTEIVADPGRMFQETRRVRYEWRIHEEVPLESVAEEIAREDQVCVVVNLRRHARRLFQKMQDMVPAEALFYITTDLCPAHRTETLTMIRQRLREGKRCCLIATQCIEAGVDLDFPVMFRALAPLDSIIQAAGRCNRNGDSPDGRVVVFCPQDDRGTYPPGEYYEMGANCVRELEMRHPIDCGNPDHIREYYQLLFSRNEGDKPSLCRAIEAEDFTGVEREYHIIEQSGINVIVPYAGRQDLFRQICNDLDREGLTNRLIHEARSITVSTYDRSFVEKFGEPLYYRSIENHGEAACTGYYILGNSELYDDKLGLCRHEPEQDLLLY